ncbi:MAG: hypothetical protein KF708_07150 [Pirellulales bacterium]|nr:hypothetical protein [Pirellulales bacterium]
MSAESRERTPPRLWIAMPLMSLAGGMGWGIRGQYGHETGAMMAGLLVGLAIAILFLARAKSLLAARAAAMFAIGISIGGSMTYGQTLGLAQDADLVGNWAALRWGLLGTTIIGGIWIGTGAAFLGMTISETRYKPVELASLLVAMLFLFFLGEWLINEPFDPAQGELPAIYFSAHWDWKPGVEIQPRHEVWGGLLLALVGLFCYVAFYRGDRLTRNLILWGILGGGLGFTGGESLQAFHAWNRDLFREGPWAEIDPLINWWNMMETTFGLVYGAILALGLWLNRHLMRPLETNKEEPVELAVGLEWMLLVVHVGAIVAWNFFSFDRFDDFADLAITMTIIPAVAVSAGRLWPFLTVLPIVAVPIVGRTLVRLSYEGDQLPVWLGWLAYVALPLSILIPAALLLAKRAQEPKSAGTFARWSLFLATATYFSLNLAFFEFPWPWEEWTRRTPNGLIYAFCTFWLFVAAIFCGRNPDKSKAAKPAKQDKTDQASSQANVARQAESQRQFKNRTN